MIIYICSYPRSGNDWVANVIRHCFGLHPSSLYHQTNSNYNYGECLETNKFIIEDSSDNTWRVLDNCKDLLTDEFRQQLAKDKSVYILQTHEFPYASYIPGEHIIHIVRNPASVFWSFYKFNNEKGYNLTIEDNIFGNATFGKWNEHTATYIAFGEQNPKIYSLFSYEEFFNGFDSLLKAITNYSALTQVNHIDTFPEFDYWHKKDKLHFRNGRNSDWKSNLTIDQLALIWILHGEVMKKCGYQIRDLHIFSPIQEQNQMGMENSMHNYEEFTNAIVKYARCFQSNAKERNLELENKCKDIEIDNKNKQAAITYLEEQIRPKNEAIAYLNEQIAQKNVGINYLKELLEQNKIKY
jgi:hypothetical protein